MKRIAALFLTLFLIANSYGQVDTTFNIWMWTTGKHNLHDGQTIKNYGFTIGVAVPTIPGPLLRVKQGQRVRLDVRNQSQGAPHTIHLHGLDVNQANDGVPSTSFVIEHKETKAYEFVAEYPGNYLYHCHVASVLHVQFGMYGSIIVEPKDREVAPGYTYGRDFNLLMSEADKSWFDNKPRHSTGDSVHAIFSLPKYEPDYFFVNGQSQQQIDTLVARSDENVLIRLSNVGYFENLIEFPEGVTATLITSDGRILPNKTVVDSLYMSQGERYGVLLSPLGNTQRTLKINYLHMFTGKKVHSEEVAFGIDETLPVDETAESTSVRLFPNPAHNEVTIGLKGSNETRIVLIDALGATHNPNIQLQGDEIKVDIKSFESGSYIIQVYQKDELVLSRSVVKF